VVASSLWQEPKERFVVGLATLIGTPRAQEYTDKLAALYTPGRSWKLINNTFVQLHKAPGR
jgi:glucan biosynthesis protein